MNTLKIKWFFFPARELHSLTNEKQWRENFKGKLFYYHGTTNSCSVAVGVFRSRSLEVVETKNDDQDRILILDMKICDKELLLVDLNNANNEKEQKLNCLKC